MRSIVDLGRFRIAVDRGAVVGCSGSFGFDMTLPGGAAVPTGGVTWVSVAVTHRRQGLLGRLLEATHEDIDGRGEPLAALTASEGGIYERFGYGIASRVRVTAIDRHRAAATTGVRADHARRPARRTRGGAARDRRRVGALPASAPRRGEPVGRLVDGGVHRHRAERRAPAPPRRLRLLEGGRALARRPSGPRDAAQPAGRGDAGGPRRAVAGRRVDRPGRDDRQPQGRDRRSAAVPPARPAGPAHHRPQRRPVVQRPRRGDLLRRPHLRDRGRPRRRRRRLPLAPRPRRGAGRCGRDPT